MHTPGWQLPELKAGCSAGIRKPPSHCVLTPWGPADGTLAATQRGEEHSAETGEPEKCRQL